MTFTKYKEWREHTQDIGISLCWECAFRVPLIFKFTEKGNNNFDTVFAPTCFALFEIHLNEELYCEDKVRTAESSIPSNLGTNGFMAFSTIMEPDIVSTVEKLYRFLKPL